jgi:uncharacterized protein with GYD domain
MPKYMIEAHYTAEGAKGVAKDGGSGRRAAVVKAAESVGGKLESLYFAFGGADVYAVLELPDNVTAAALSLAVNQGGAVATKTIVLLTPEEMDKAAKKTVAYRGPGHLTLEAPPARVGRVGGSWITTKGNPRHAEIFV